MAVSIAAFDFILANTVPLDVYMCPSGWTKLGTQLCIRRIDIAKTWHESLAECERLSSGNGSLASIHSRQEIDLLLNVLDRNESWIGLNDIDNEGIYDWADDSPLVYVNWKSSRRDKSSLQREKFDCIAATNSSWQLRNCSEKKKSLCRSPAFIGRSMRILEIIVNFSSSPFISRFQ